MNKFWFKSIFIWVLILVSIYLLAEFLFFRGYLIDTRIGVVEQVFSGIPKASGAGPLIHYANVKLESGEYLKVVCEPICHLDSKVRVSSYKPLLGGGINFYATGI
ncbi:hypothetical protein AWH61_16375 [Alteromonas sp. W12]|jgi:hypothetical protein|uniref:hypothetical protein n=1 Tax=Alteromonas sp. W12 TaxID=1772289 RepID=UPI000948FA82|nr:hypothetical protein [Alteromonas sp. W12]OLF72431.1 hypothetical protein AWH61_16375 [Alteromonas sp. W12]